MGSTITNFLSASFVVDSYRQDGTAGEVKFREGRLVSKGVTKIKNPGKHGLTTTFLPSEMVGEITVAPEEVLYLTWQLCNLSSIGTNIEFNVITNNEDPIKTIIKNTNGLNAILETISGKNLFDPVAFSLDNGTRAIDCIFTYDIKEMEDTRILSYANFCPTTSGTHVDGFLDALIKYFRKYMNEIYLANNKKLQVTAQDIRTGLRVVIAVKDLFPLFTGQSKEVYSAVDMKPFSESCTRQGIDEWSKSHPTELQKLGKYIKEICEIRSKIDNEKIRLSDKYTASAITGLPAKYLKPNEKGPFELFIVEGDSAMGGIQNNRDKAHQAVFPIRGKILNAMVTSTPKFFANEEVAGLTRIFGYNGYHKVFDPYAFKPEKVIITTDADADGSHIACLLLMMFLRYFPFVIEQGKLYVANPPLYGINIGKGKMKFFGETKEYIEYVKNIFCKDNLITDINKVPLTSNQIFKLLSNNMDYITYLTHVSYVFAIDIHFLEFLLYNRSLTFTKFRNLIEKTYPFVKVTVENGVTMIRGLVGDNYQTIFFNERLMRECDSAIYCIDNSDKYYYLNGRKATLLDIMIAYKNCEPGQVTRYKGLGEMPPKLLGETVIIPGKGRMLRQYTTSDVKKELGLISSLQSNKADFIKGIKIRKEDIE